MYISSLADPRLRYSKSQLNQDIFVLNELGLKTHGYFVEFGATNGVSINNTWLLEKHFNWQGILAEPSRYWHNDLKHNRSAHISTDCVWSSSGDNVLFNEVDSSQANYGPELSTVDVFSGCDNHSATRTTGKKYSVTTVSLMDLLSTHHAPRQIDYLSIDTEGSEFEILKAFDFDYYDITTITCEHNYTPMREKIFDLLLSKGYHRKHHAESKWDDWYSKLS